MDDVYNGVRHFLVREAKLLDRKRYWDWYDTLAEDVRYRVPVGVTQDMTYRSSEESFLFDEDRSSLRARIERMDGEYAWSEKPPSRTRRLVGNVYVVDREGNEATVESSLVLLRWKGEHIQPRILSGEREDRLRFDDGDVELAERTFHLDQHRIDLTPVSIIL
jgi:3-phenylpropionate/cinnamic acid dioxygenase small subunit